ncbi:MAG: hypothetical protein K0R78_670 [Pelosinus sp.]|jgi:hypothetical protein|nr:hypothetical protein [Pelosinus sp.]
MSIIDKTQLNDLTMLVLNKSQFVWEEKDITKLSEEIARKYIEVNKILKEEFKKNGYVL